MCAECAMSGRPLYAIPSKRAWCDLEKARRWAQSVVYEWEWASTAWQRARGGIVRRMHDRELKGAYAP